MDLEKFFDRVNWDILMGRLSKRITEKRVLQLKQWKRGRRAYRELVARGLPPIQAARVAKYTCRW